MASAITLASPAHARLRKKLPSLAEEGDLVDILTILGEAGAGPEEKDDSADDKKLELELAKNVPGSPVGGSRHKGVADLLPEDLVLMESGGTDLEDPLLVQSLREKFFSANRGDATFKRHREAVLAVCVPFYNEEYDDMERTLNSLYESFKDLLSSQSAKKIEHVCVLLVGDGVSQCKPSMKAYLSKCFKVKPEDLTPPENSVARIINEGRKRVFKHREVRVSFLLKRQNGGKAHSQELFCKLFVRVLNCKYIFLTDCGTSYETTCLRWLRKYIISHPKCVGCTGHQRILPMEKQKLEFNFQNTFMSYSQGFDYESSQHSFARPFSAIGCLPVIPGPCGMYNIDLLLEKPKIKDNNGKSALYDYFDILKESKTCEEPELIKSNLVLAEDRILCFLAVQKSNYEYFTAMEPRAVFFFEAETDWKKLLQQRRRWLNGTLAGYIWTFQQMKLDWKLSCCPPGRLRLLFFFVCLQLLICSFNLISPGVFTMAFYFSLTGIFENLPTTYVTCFVLWYVAVQVIFIGHHWQKSQTALRVDSALAYILSNAVVSIVVLLAYGYALKGIIPDFINYCFGGPSVILADMQNFILTTFKLLPLCWMTFPLMLALMHSFSSFKLCIKYLFFYVPMLPTMVVTLPLYAICRTWELSWGNRPDEASEAKKEEKLMHFAKQALNIGAYDEAIRKLEDVKVMGFNGQDLDKAQLKSLQKFEKKVKVGKELQDIGNLITLIVVVINALLGFVALALQTLYPIAVFFSALIAVPMLIFQLIAIALLLIFILWDQKLGLVPLWMCLRSRVTAAPPTPRSPNEHSRTKTHTFTFQRFRKNSAQQKAQALYLKQEGAALAL